MAELGRQGGLKISMAKADAARKNGAKRGHPKKSVDTHKIEVAKKIFDSDPNMILPEQNAQ